MKGLPNILDVVILTVAVLSFGRVYVSESESGFQFLSFPRLPPLLLSPFYLLSFFSHILYYRGEGGLLVLI